MLTPEQIKEASSSMTDLMQNLEEFVIKDITKRLKKALDDTPTAEIQTVQAINYGISTDKIQEAYTSVFGKADKRLKTIIESAGRLNVEQENSRLEKAGYSVSLTPALKGLINDISKQTRGLFKNLSNTSAIGFTKQTKSGSKFLGTSAFITDALDDAIMKFRTGVQSPAEALRDAIKTMGDSGLTVKFKSGYKCNIESAFKRAIKTGVNQLSSIQNAEIADELELPLAEVTAHAGARPDHKKWQGKVYQIHGSSKKYKNLAKETGLGRVDGLLGANCRHQWYGYAEGMPRTYTDKELENIDPPDIEYNGKTYSFYDAEQYKNRLESNMRSLKREIAGYEESGDAESLALAKKKLADCRKELKNFNKAAVFDNSDAVKLEQIDLKKFDFLSDETRQSMVEFSQDMDEEDIAKFNKIFKQADIKTDTNSWYDPVSKTVYIDSGTADRYTAFHECSHWFDYEQKYICSYDEPKRKRVLNDEGKIVWKDLGTETIVVKEDASFSQYINWEWGAKYEKDGLTKEDKDYAVMMKKLKISGNFGSYNEHIQEDRENIRSYLKSKNISMRDKDYVHLSDFISAITYDSNLGSAIEGGHEYDYWMKTGTRVAEITAGYSILRALGREDLIAIERDLAPNLMQMIEEEWSKIW